MDVDKYKEYLNNNVTKDYKKADEKVVDDITKNDKVVASKLEIGDRVYCTNVRLLLPIRITKSSFLTNRSDKSN